MSEHKKPFAYEIPFDKDKNFQYRFFEILPGFLSWTALITPFFLAFFYIRLTAWLMIAYLLLWFVKAIALNVRALQGWSLFEQHVKIDWEVLIKDLKERSGSSKLPKWHHNNIARITETPNGIDPDQVIHAIIVATWNEAREILQPTLENVKNAVGDQKKMIVLLAYEDRGGPAVDKQAQDAMMKEYEGVFLGVKQSSTLTLQAK